MQLLWKYLVFVVLTIVPCTFLFAQDPSESVHDTAASVKDVTKGSLSVPDSLLTIRYINIIGNKRTKERLIHREIPFKEGEQYPLHELVKKFEDARRQLMNTVLFHEVMVALQRTEGNYADILIDVRERWYLFPVPYFRYIDRNLNQWLVENKGDLRRVNYGIKMFHNNATGLNDKFNIWLMNGYTKQISLGYDRLYLDRGMKWGLNFNIGMGKNREVNYSTENNKQIFFKDTNNFVRSFFRTNLELSYRPAIKTRHKFGFSYQTDRVNDTILKLNPKYFGNDGSQKLKYAELYYSVSYWDVDYIPYPLTGYLGEFHFVKKGFSKEMDMWQLMAKAGGGWKIGKDLYFSTRVTGTLKLPFRQPFINQRLLGYSDFTMQGYEYYVVDGVAGGYVKATVTRQILNFNIHYRKKKTNKLQRIPFRIFAKAYTNAGYVHSPEPGFNQLNNKMLYSGGFGIDLITLYDFSLRFEWSFNHLGQNGLYLHRKTNF